MEAIVVKKKKNNRYTNNRSTEKMKEDYLKAAAKTMGQLTEACNNAHITKQTYYYWMKNDPEFREKVEALREQQKDFVEEALIRKIEEGDTKAIMFAAKCLLKDRGFSEKSEMNINVPTEYFLKLGTDAENTKTTKSAEDDE